MITEFKINTMTQESYDQNKQELSNVQLNVIRSEASDPKLNVPTYELVKEMVEDVVKITITEL